MRYVPTNAAYLTVGGGVLVLFGGLAESFNGSHWPGIVNGLLIVLAGLLMMLLPENMSAWAVFAIVLAFCSFLTASFGGFLVGFLLTIIGATTARRYRVPDVGAAPAGTMIPGGAYAPSDAKAVQPLPSAGSSGSYPAPDQSFVAAPPLAAIYCPRCGRPARYFPEYAMYYCDTDRQYL